MGNPAVRREACFFPLESESLSFLSKESLDGELICWTCLLINSPGNRKVGCSGQKMAGSETEWKGPREEGARGTLIAPGPGSRLIQCLSLYKGIGGHSVPACCPNTRGL